MGIHVVNSVHVIVSVYTHAGLHRVPCRGRRYVHTMK